MTDPQVARLATQPWDPQQPDAGLCKQLAAPQGRPEFLGRFLAAARAYLRTAHDNESSGSSVAASWSRLLDHLVGHLFLCGGPERPWGGATLLALGEYGRREPGPQSPVEVLILAPNGSLAASRIEELVHPLRHAGLDLRVAVRSPAEAGAWAAAGWDRQLRLMDARCLAGSAGCDDTQDLPEIPGDPTAWLQGAAAELEQRHSQHGGTVYLLEPHVRAGQGGLQDFHTARWTARVHFRQDSLEALADAGAASAAEVRELRSAHEFLLRLRNQMHFTAGRCEERLHFELQDQVAPELGFRDLDGTARPDRLLQRYYLAANRVHLFTSTLLRRAFLAQERGSGEREAPQPGVELRNGELYLDPEAVRQRPLLLLSAFEICQLHDVELSSQALEVIQNNLERVDDRFRRDPEAVALFLRVLRRPRRVATTLLRMHDVHFLDRFIPEFKRVYGRTQRDLYHVYPVDVHSLFAVQVLRQLARGQDAVEYPLLTRLIAELRRPDVLYLATLLHDIGKGAGRAHEERGAEIALAVADRMGLEQWDRESLVFLVRHHLDMALTAQGRDLHDRTLIETFAEQVGDLELLNMLYLLTVADIRAVGPGAWTPWKHLLLQELYEKAAHVLSGGRVGRALGTSRTAEVCERVRAAVADTVPADEVEAFLANVGHARYLLANPVAALVRHLRAFQRRGDRPVVEIRPVPDEGYTEILLITRDKPGLFAQVAGLLAAHGFNILSAVLNPRRDGWVLDLFHVTGTGRFEAEPWQPWRTALTAVLCGHQGLEAAVGSQWRRRGPHPAANPVAPGAVTVDNDVSKRFTVVDLRAADRIGLLYDVARTLAAQGVNIHLAKIATTIRQVSDSFYVERVGGGKVEDPAALASLERALREAVEEQP